MRNVIGLHHGQNSRYTDAVVGSECRPVSGDPVAIDVGVDRVLGEIERLVVVFLRNHIHMGLQDNPLARLHPFCGGLAQDYVAGFVGFAFDTVRAGLVQ